VLRASSGDQLTQVDESVIDINRAGPATAGSRIRSPGGCQAETLMNGVSADTQKFTVH
jgi:hypothetical protein